MKILNKRLFRNIRHSFIKYSLVFSLFMIGIMIFVALAVSADTVSGAVLDLKEKSNCEDGYFNVFVPLSDMQRKELNSHGVELEENFYIEQKESSTDAVVRIYKNREKIDLVQLKDGKNAQNDHEIVIEQHYADYYGYDIGDQIIINNESYKITGLGYSIDYDSIYKDQTGAYPDFTVFCVAFVSDMQFQGLLADNKPNYYYAYRISDKEDAYTYDLLHEWLCNMEFDESKIQDKYMKEIVEDARDFEDKNVRFEENEEIYGAVFDVLNKYITVKWRNLINMVKSEDNVRINSFTNDMITNKSCALPMGVTLFVALSFITAAIAITDIRKEHHIIGTLYALGYNTNALTFHFTILPVLNVFIASACGTGLGFLMAHPLMSNYINGGAVSNLNVQIEAYIIVYGIICPTVISIIINWIVIKNALSKPVLMLFQNVANDTGNMNLNMDKFSFKLTYQFRLMVRDWLYYFILLISLIITIFMLLFGISLYGTLTTWRASCYDDIKFENKYYYMFPSEKVPEGGEAAYYKILNKDFPLTGKDMQVELIGIQNNSAYFDCNFDKYERDEIIASTSAMIKFNWKIGERITLNSPYNDESYEFTIVDAVKYSYGLCLFMNIDSMRTYFETDENYWNMVFSNKQLDIDPERLAATLKKDDAVLGAENRTNSLMSIIYLLSCMGIFIFIGMMYVVISIITNKSESPIAILYIMGYNRKEVTQLYLVNSLYITIISMLISIPVSFNIVSGIYPNIIAIVPNGMSVYLPFYLWILIILIILGAWSVVFGFMSRKISKTLFFEILRQQQ